MESGAAGAPPDWLVDALVDSNITIERVDRLATPVHPAAGVAGREGISYVLADDRGRALLLCTRDGTETTPDRELMRSVQGAVTSVVREEISRRTLDTFAFLLVVEGKDGTRNREVHDLVTEAIGRLREMESLLPRPLGYPLRTMGIDMETRPQEEVLLWSLGLDSASPEPAVALVYGRGKLAGPVLVGPRITKREILLQLALVGDSCECDTDRDWVNDPFIPLRWSPAQRESAMDHLGFNPGSPLVKAEIAQIINRGLPLGTARGGGVPSVESILLGYREFTIDEGTDSDVRQDPGRDTGSGGGEEQGTRSSIIPGPDDMVLTAAAEGDGWDFEDQHETGDPGVMPQPIPESHLDALNASPDSIVHQGRRGVNYVLLLILVGGLLAGLLVLGVRLGRG